MKVNYKQDDDGAWLVHDEDGRCLRYETMKEAVAHAAWINAGVQEVVDEFKNFAEGDEIPELIHGDTKYQFSKNYAGVKSLRIESMGPGGDVLLLTLDDNKVLGIGMGQVCLYPSMGVFLEGTNVPEIKGMDL